VLNVRNLYDIIRVDAEFIGYYRNVKQNNMFIKFFDTVGIRVPSIIPYPNNKLTAPFKHPPPTISIVNSKRDDNLIVDISDYVTFKTTTNGMTDVTIVTPLTIYRNLSISGWIGQMITTIDTKWNIVTTYKSENAWPNDADNYSNVLGDLRIEANINEENNINTGDGNVGNVYKRRNMFSRYTQNIDTFFNRDNFIYLSRTINPFTISHNLNYNKETLSFRNLDNLVRIYTDIVRYYYKEEKFYTLDDRSNIKNTLTLMCKYKPPTTDKNDENKKAYFSVSKPPTLIKNSIQIDNLPLVFTNPPYSAVGYYDIDLDPQLNTYSPFYFYRDEPDNKFKINVTNVSIKTPQESNPVNIGITEIKKHVNLDNKNILRLKMLDTESVSQIKSCELTARCEPDIFSGYKTLSRIKLTWKILNMGMTIIIEPI